MTDDRVKFFLDGQQITEVLVTIPANTHKPDVYDWTIGKTHAEVLERVIYNYFNEWAGIPPPHWKPLLSESQIKNLAEDVAHRIRMAAPFAGAFVEGTTVERATPPASET